MRFKIFITITFFVLTFFYFTLPLRVGEFSQTFLTIASFLFAIFGGFFISRQGQRYTELRQNISSFDGVMSFVYRSFSHFAEQPKKQLQGAIFKHYQVILKNRAWDYHLNRPSKTLKDIHQIINQNLATKNLKTLQTNVLNRIMAALLQAQMARKNMVSIYQERIPKFQWLLIFMLALILLFNISSIPSQFAIWASLIKAAFGSIVVLVLLLLYQFDNLEFFENIIGEHSAQDVIKLIMEDDHVDKAGK